MYAKLCMPFSGECRIASDKCSKKSVNQKNHLFAHHLNNRILFIGLRRCILLFLYPTFHNLNAMLLGLLY